MNPEKEPTTTAGGGTPAQSAEATKVGVYVCHCGGNISDVVDVAKVAEELGKHPNVAVAKTFMFMCSDPGQQLIIDDIKANGINRVVVSACAPALHELTFRKALQRAGLNPYLYENVNVREQVSWVHKGKPEDATRKAIRLTRAGVEKVVRQDPLQAIRVEAEPHVVVIGAGIAGLRAAVALGKRGLGVTLLEKGDRVGGRLLELDTVYPTGEKASSLVESLAGEVEADPRVELILKASISEIDGYVGNFTVRLAGGREIRAGAIVIATGVRHYEPFDGELGYGESSPWPGDSLARGKTGERQRTEMRVQETGASEPPPARPGGTGRASSPSFAFGETGGGLLGTVTLPQLNAALRDNPDSLKAYKNVAFVHCVGSRQTDGIHPPQPDGKVNDYCSRVCCTAALHTVNNLLDRFPETNVYEVYKDIRTYGRGHEDYYEQASKKGVLFFRYNDEGPPTLENGKIKVKDWLTWGEEVEIPVDLVVLVTGLMPNDVSDLIGMMKLPVGADRFLQEVHPKLRPVELANNGVLVAGAAQGPMDIVESCAAAEAAAVKASILLGKGSIELDPFVARVDEAKCDGCKLCFAECEYKDALELVAGKAKVNPAICVGCGACAAVCPPRAIQVAGWTLDQFDAMVDELVAEEV